MSTMSDVGESTAAAPSEPVSAGRDALSRHAWQEAFDRLSEADPLHKLDEATVTAQRCVPGIDVEVDQTGGAGLECALQALEGAIGVSYRIRTSTGSCRSRSVLPRGRDPAARRDSRPPWRAGRRHPERPNRPRGCTSSPQSRIRIGRTQGPGATIAGRSPAPCGARDR